MGSTERTKRKEMGSSHGQMAENMLENGILESNTVLVTIHLQKENKGEENGKMERESNGLTNKYE